MILNNCRLISNVKLLYPVILIEICFNSCVPDNNSSEKGIKETMHTLPLKNEQYWDDPEFMISDKKYERMINCIDGFLVDAPEIFAVVGTSGSLGARQVRADADLNRFGCRVCRMAVG